MHGGPAQPVIASHIQDQRSAAPTSRAILGMEIQRSQSGRIVLDIKDRLRVDKSGSVWRMTPAQPDRAGRVRDQGLAARQRFGLFMASFIKTASQGVVLTTKDQLQADDSGSKRLRVQAQQVREDG